MAESELNKYYKLINTSTYISNLNQGLVIDPNRRILSEKINLVKQLKKDQDNLYSR